MVVPRDRPECSLCLHPRDSHADDCLFRTHEIDVRWLREKVASEEEADGKA